MATKRIPAAAYLRRSSSGQDLSIDQQREAIDKWASEHDYQIVETYIDDSISGDANERRDQYRRLILDADENRWQAVLAYKRDRFSRADSMETAHYNFMLRRAGVHLCTVCDGRIDWESMQGRLLDVVETEGKHQFLRDLSDNVTRSHRSQASKGYFAGGSVPVGYHAVGDPRARRLQPNELAPTIRELFEKRASGWSARMLADWMNAQGHLTGKGNAYTARTVNSILRSKAYIGTLERRSSGRSKYQTEPWEISIEGSHEAIVSRELFDRVQLLLDQKTGSAGFTGETFALAGMVVCPGCQGSMAGWVDKRKRGAPRKYACANYTTKRSCQRWIVGEAELLQAFNDDISRQFATWLATRDPDEFFVSFEEYQQHHQQTHQANTRRLEVIDGKLARARDRIIEVDREFVPLVQTKIRQLEAERRRAMAHAPMPDCRAEYDRHIETVDHWLLSLVNLHHTIRIHSEEPQQLRQLLSGIGLTLEPYLTREPVRPGSRRHTCRLLGGRARLSIIGVDPGIIRCIRTDGLRKETVVLDVVDGVLRASTWWGALAA